MTGWLTQEEIDGARGDLAELLDATCTLRRRSQAGWDTLATGVPCRVQMVGSGVNYGLSLAAADVDGAAVLTLPAGTNIGDQRTVKGVLQALIVGDPELPPRRFEAQMVRPRQAFLLRIVGTVES